uniref:Uncharacterized protein n=1 Tax=Romanomermis culicivorax TaxID=13658 RepID=A0A915IW41_ROMCU
MVVHCNYDPENIQRTIECKFQAQASGQNEQICQNFKECCHRKCSHSFEFRARCRTTLNENEQFQYDDQTTCECRFIKTRDAGGIAADLYALNFVSTFKNFRQH